MPATARPARPDAQQQVVPTPVVPSARTDASSDASRFDGRRDPAAIADAAMDPDPLEEPDAQYDDGDPTPVEIAERAYSLYLARGGQDGNDIDDWLEAERDLRAARLRQPPPGQTR